MNKPLLVFTFSLDKTGEATEVALEEAPKRFDAPARAYELCAMLAAVDEEGHVLPAGRYRLWGIDPILDHDDYDKFVWFVGDFETRPIFEVVPIDVPLYRYFLFLNGSGSIRKIKAALLRRGIAADMRRISTGVVWRIPQGEVKKLPTDKDGPYLPDGTGSGWSLTPPMRSHLVDRDVVLKPTSDWEPVT